MRCIRSMDMDERTTPSNAEPRPEPGPSIDRDQTVEDLNQLSEALRAAQLMIQALEKSTAQTFSLEDRTSRNPVRQYEFEAGFTKAERELVEFAARRLTEYPEILDTGAVATEFKGKDFDAAAIKAYIRENFDGKADELALAKIKKEAGSLVPWGIYNDETQRRERKVEVRGRRLKLRCYLDWSYGRLSPYRLSERCHQLDDLERLARYVLRNTKPREALKVPGRFWVRYEDLKGQADLLKRHEFHGLIKAVKLHKNGSLYVWWRSETEAQQMAQALKEAGA